MSKKISGLVPMKENKLLVEVVIGGFLGSLSGIILGLILSILIWGISHIIFIIGQNSYQATQEAPLSVITFMGMGLGAVLGAIFGSTAGLKQQK